MSNVIYLHDEVIKMVILGTKSEDQGQEGFVLWCTTIQYFEVSFWNISKEYFSKHVKCIKNTVRENVFSPNHKWWVVRLQMMTKPIQKTIKLHDLHLASHLSVSLLKISFLSGSFLTFVEVHPANDIGTNIKVMELRSEYKFHISLLGQVASSFSTIKCE